MKLKEWFKTLLSGMGIGLGAAIPGVSGGTIAVILKVYEKILWAVANFFKEFKKAVIYLIPVLLGVVLALIPTIYLMDKALDGFVFGIVCLFAGFIIGSIPGIKDEVKGEPIKWNYILALIVALFVAILLGIGSVYFGSDASQLIYNPTWWVYLVLIPVGVLASIALVIPGISGSMLLLLIGFYKPLISITVDTVKEVFSGNFTHFGSLIGILFCFGIGVLIGFYFISKLMHFLINRYHHATFYAILGFVIGSTVALFFNYEIYSYYQLWAQGTFISVPYYVEIPIGVTLLVLALIGSYLLVRYLRKAKNNENIEVSE